MVSCKKCGKKIPEDSEYCRECGAKLSVSKTIEVKKPSELINKKSLMIIGLAILIGIIIIIVLIAVKEPPNYPDDFVLRYDEVPPNLKYLDFTCQSYLSDDKESCLQDLKEIGAYGLDNPGYLPTKLYDRFTDTNVDEKRINSIYFTIFEEKGNVRNNLGVCIINYNSERDLEVELSKIYSSWEGEILQYKNILVIIGSDNFEEEVIQIVKNLRKRLPLKVIKTRENM